MSEPTAPAPEVAPEAAPDDLSFVDSFQAFLKGGTEPAPEPAPEPEPEPAPAPKPEPEPKKDPVEELAEARDDIDPDLKLPIDDTDDDGEPVADGEDDKDNPFDKGTPQHRRFREMRKEAAALKGTLEQEKQTRTQLESRVKEIEAAAARTDELEKKLAEYEAKITVSNLTESAAYQEAIAKPLNNIIDRADAIAERYGIDPDDLTGALEIADPAARRAKFKELTSGLDVEPDDHYELRKLADELQPLKTKRAELIANADKALQELETERTETQKQAALQAAEARKAAVKQVADKVASQVPMLKSLDGLDYDGIVESTRETDFDQLNPPTKAYNHMAGLMLPKLLKAHTQLTRQIEQLSDDLSAYKKQSPRMTPDEGGGPRDKGSDDEGFLERAKRELYGQR